MKKKVLLFTYSRTNLGDDLFLYILLKRYPDIEFYIKYMPKEHLGVLKYFNNCTSIFDDKLLNQIELDNYDACIYIGGSIFMESSYAINDAQQYSIFIKKCKEKNIPFFYMSSNFGPYKTEEYLNLITDNFKNCADICFRDKKSFEKFSYIPNVRYAPDVGFLYQSQSIKKNSKCVGISVIDLSIRPILSEYEQEYCTMLANNIIKFINKGNNVYLFSFCNFEGDNNEIDKIINDYIPEDYRSKINIVEYDGDFEKFLEIYKKMKYMICTRFHSLILSLIFRQKVYTVSYSSKIDNIIEDLHINSNCLDIKDSKSTIELRKSKFKRTNIFKINKIIKKANEQFAKFDEWRNSL